MDVRYGDCCLGSCLGDDKADTVSRSRTTSACSSSISVGWDGVTPATASEAAAITLSPSSGNSSSVLSALEVARTMWTFAGRRWRKSSRKSVPSASTASGPSSCCIRHSSCVGRWSPSSVEWTNCCSLLCWGMVVRAISCRLSVS